MNRVIFENDPSSYIKFAYPRRSLQRVVEYYFEVRSEDEANIFGLPSANSLLAFQLEGNSRSRNEKTGQWISIPRIALLGNSSTPFTGNFPGSSAVFYVKLKPLAKFTLFDFPGNELLNNQVDVESALQNFSGCRFQEQTDFQSRVSIIEDYLERAADPKRLSYQQLYAELLLQSFSDTNYVKQLNIEHLCFKLNLTYSSMRRYCLDALGVSPKFFQKSLRFKAALRNYKHHGSNFNTDDFGYNDFSHFYKDAWQLTGRGPAAL
ncbi:DUF6597 domain-containing transcriptional factor [Desertivirga arenae]|uniref:DUF6597 domain-containing transcriptional factor n=1 Tax=Desertivirga arenae TaxID=2810309 RepID=UPI001A959FD8|nr:DUF6597 domain-containing transcriptional factor [Pedobacter sp. SYSU D00823]